MLKQSPKQTAIARKLRRDDTWAERLLWRWLRDRRFSAYKFRRQQPMGSHTLDFFCAEARLNIELDGSQHGHPAQAQADAERDRWLAGHGIKVLRYWNGRLRREKQVVREASGRRCRNARRNRCRIIAGRVRWAGALRMVENRWADIRGRCCNGNQRCCVCARVG